MGKWIEELSKNKSSKPRPRQVVKWWQALEKGTTVNFSLCILFQSDRFF